MSSALDSLSCSVTAFSTFSLEKKKAKQNKQAPNRENIFKKKKKKLGRKETKTKVNAVGMDLGHQKYQRSKPPSWIEEGESSSFAAAAASCLLDYY